MKNRWIMGMMVLVTMAIGMLACSNCRHGSALKSLPSSPMSPSVVVASADNKSLYILCATSWQVAIYDIAAGKLTDLVPVPAEPSGIARSADGSRLYVTCSDPKGTIAVLNAAGKLLDTWYAGQAVCAPVINAQGTVLYVARRFTHQIVALDTATAKPIWTVPVVREPVAASLTPDGDTLLVANLLPSGTAVADVVAASVSMIDVRKGQLIANLTLPSGSTSLHDIRVSPDGKLAAVPHILGRFNVPTTQLERGWMNTNAFSLIDIPGKKLLNTILLDDVDSGAANPFAVAWTADGRRLCVTHAGTQELSVIDAPALLAKLAQETNPTEIPNDLAYLVDLRKRVKLPGNGPRSLAIVGDKAYVPEYFTDSLTVVDLASGLPQKVALAATIPMTVQRKGEMLFHDASLCFQGWQSCSSCHPDARADGLNWDLLNDGIGNPKNTRSMLLAHDTPPAMSLGIRATAEVAVRAGIRYIQFATRPEEDAAAIDEYLKSLKPTPSPFLIDGKLSSSARRGQQLFNDSSIGCASCHAPGLFTNGRPYNVGTRGNYDGTADTFDTPTLVEVWRTAPYLHDGSAATIKDVITTHNNNDQHGHTSQLTPQQIEDLVAYVLSL